MRPLAIVGLIYSTSHIVYNQYHDTWIVAQIPAQKALLWDCGIVYNNHNTIQTAASLERWVLGRAHCCYYWMAQIILFYTVLSRLCYLYI